MSSFARTKLRNRDLGIARSIDGSWITGPGRETHRGNPCKRLGDGDRDLIRPLNLHRELHGAHACVKSCASEAALPKAPASHV